MLYAVIALHPRQKQKLENYFFFSFMVMPITSIDKPNTTSTAPAHASVASNIRAAPNNTSSTDNKRLVDCFLIITNLNDSSEHVPGSHLKHDPLSNHLDRRGAKPHQCLERDGYLSLSPTWHHPDFLSP